MTTSVSAKGRGRDTVPLLLLSRLRVHFDALLTIDYGGRQPVPTQAPPLQMHLMGHVPHSTSTPQPFDAFPHDRPCVVQGSGSGVQPHMFAVPPPPQVLGAVQVPHITWTPQLLATGPQFLFTHA